MNAPSKLIFFGSRRKNQRGAVVILVGLMLFVLVGFAALSIDVTNMEPVARSELQNAADAGALAGARCLYNDSDALPDCLDSGGTVGHVNQHANQIAFNAATANTSQKIPVDVNWTADVERGHWNFITRTFTPNDSLEPVNLWNVSAADLAANTNFINAVRVTTRRQATPINAWFGRIFGYTDYERAMDAVAWIGFAGTLQPFDVDQPIAICQDDILNAAGEYTCNVGRFIHEGIETGEWTNYSQGESCPVPISTNTNTIRPLVCGEGNPNPLIFGLPIGTNNGRVDTLYEDLVPCWTTATNRIRNWSVTLPVIDCINRPNASCARLVGAVTVDILWIQNGNPRPIWGDDFNCLTQSDNTGPNNPRHAPCRMTLYDGEENQITNPAPWNGTSILNNGERWNDFVDHFNLQLPDGRPAYWENDGWTRPTIYFRPSCTAHEPTGTSGGENFGILADIPRLVN